jgi:hypothetical protein
MCWRDGWWLLKGAWIVLTRKGRLTTLERLPNHERTC